MDGWETKTTGGEEVHHACTARTDAPNQKPKPKGCGQLLVLVLVLHRQGRPTPAEGPGQTRTQSRPAPGHRTFDLHPTMTSEQPAATLHQQTERESDLCMFSASHRHHKSIKQHSEQQQQKQQSPVWSASSRAPSTRRWLKLDIKICGAELNAKCSDAEVLIT